MKKRKYLKWRVWKEFEYSVNEARKHKTQKKEKKEFKDGKNNVEISVDKYIEWNKMLDAKDYSLCERRKLMAFFNFSFLCIPDSFH